MSEKDTKQETILYEDLAIIVASTLCLSLSIFTTVLGDMALITFLIACVLLPVGLYDMSRILFNIHPLTTLKKFRKDTHALAWIWIVGFVLSIPMCALIYFVLDYPFDIIATYVEGTTTFTGTMAYAWTATEFIISYLLALCLILSVLWVIINSKSPGVY